MEKVIALGLNKVNLSDLQEICTNVEKIAQKGLSKSEIHLLAPFQDRLQTFCAAIKGNSDLISAALAELDVKVDTAYEAIGLILRANVMHYDIRIAEISAEVQNIFNEIEDPTALPYDQEYPAILRLLTLFDSLPTKDLALSGVAGWIAELRQRYQAFMVKLNELEQMKEAKHASVVKSSRLALIAAYKDLIDQLNALYMFQPSPEHEAILTALHAYFETKRTQAKTKAKKTSPLKSV